MTLPSGDEVCLKQQIYVLSHQTETKQLLILNRFLTVANIFINTTHYVESYACTSRGTTSQWIALFTSSI